jgi:hypothetical protein
MNKRGLYRLLVQREKLPVKDGKVISYETFRKQLNYGSILARIAQAGM